MRFFNLDEYLKKPSLKVVTRDGRKVRIICTDYKGSQPIIGLVATKEEKEEKEIAYCFTEKGNQYSPIERERKPELDLFFAPIKKEGWVNIYDITRINCISRIYKTKEEAETIGKGCKSGYITTVKIEWEE